MQDRPGAPGTARKGIARTIVPATCGGVAAPKAPGPDHPLATAARLPGQGRPRAVPPARDHDRSRARHTMAPGHGRPRTASSDAARHDRPCATPRAPGADVPPATTAGAPGQYCLSAVPAAPDPERSDARHQRAPGRGRPLAASSDTVGHDRPRATPRAPGADVPSATTAGAPGQHRLSAAPSHDRPSVAPSGVAEHDRPRATLRAPGHDVPLVTVARAPGYGRPCAAHIVPDHQRSHRAPMAPPGHALASAGTSVPSTTAPLPARVSRLHQERLSSITATPNTLTHPQSHRLNCHYRRLNRHSRSRHNPRPPVATGGPQGGDVPRSHRHSANHCLASTPPLYMVERGPGGEESHTTRPIHPSRLQPRPVAHHRPPPACIPPPSRVPARHPPPRPRASRANPTPAPLRPRPLPWSLLRGRAREGARGRRVDSPSLPGKGPGVRSTLLPLSKCWRGGRGVRNVASPALTE